MKIKNIAKVHYVTFDPLKTTFCGRTLFWLCFGSATLRTDDVCMQFPDESVPTTLIQIVSRLLVY